VGKAELKNIQEIIHWSRELNKFQLVYIFAKNRPQKYPFPNIMHLGTLVKFNKSIEKRTKAPPLQFLSFDQDEGIYALSKPDDLFKANLEMVNQVNKSLRQLALKSGEFSRFKLDRRLIQSEYEKLYSEWIKKAIGGKEKLLV